MKEIGEKLKDARESIGISIEEVAEDLKTLPSQIEEVETGNMDAFKDIFSLKYFIRDYSKYLGLSYDDMVDEFNEYLFDYTSRLSLDDIKNAKKKDKEEKKIASPYTVEHKAPRLIPPIIIYIAILLLIGVIVYFVLGSNNSGNLNNGNGKVISDVVE